MNRGLKAQLNVFVVVISTIRRNIHAIYCSQEFFQSTTKVGMVAVFTKFPQKVGDLNLYVVKTIIHCLQDAVRFY